MQVTETLSEGLKREYKVSVPAAELDAKLTERLNTLKTQVRINGFRPGKVPVEHLKRLYGRSAMAEAIEATVRDTNSQIVADKNLRLATEPKVTLPEEQDAIEQVISGKRDLDYTIALEIVPPIEIGDLKSIKLKKPVADIEDAEVEEALRRLAEQNRPYASKAAGEGAAKDDHVTINFTGSIDGKPFEGGTGEDVRVAIGSGTFIPGFEDQLIGAKAGEQREITATFPTNYLNSTLAGKIAKFDTTIKTVEAPGNVQIDDEFAKKLGLESLEKLRAAIKDRLTKEHAEASRAKLKRALLDALDKSHKFEAPPSLVGEEFDRVWKSVNTELERQGRTFADEETTEDEARKDYREIAERRVRLGLLLNEIGERNKITVSDEELSRGVIEHARRYPGQEQRVWDYYRQNPQALGALRAPLFEEKVVDFLLELAKVEEQKVSREDLFKDDDEAA